MEILTNKKQIEKFVFDEEELFDIVSVSLTIGRNSDTDKEFTDAGIEIMHNLIAKCKIGYKGEWGSKFIENYEKTHSKSLA